MSQKNFHINMSSEVIVFDGIIAAGKTTFIENAVRELERRGFSVVVVREPVEKWKNNGMLARFYGDIKRYAYNFQTMAFHDRVAECINAAKTPAQIYLLERSCFTDNLFMEMLHDDGKVDDLEMQNYRDWWSLWYHVMPFQPTLFVYIRPSMNACMERIRARARPGEEVVGEDYQTRLQAKHDALFESGSVDVQGKSVPCIKITSENDFREMEQVRQTIDMLLAARSITVASSSDSTVIVPSITPPIGTGPFDLTTDITPTTTTTIASNSTTSRTCELL